MEDTTDREVLREVLRLAVLRLNRLDRKVDDHLAATQAEELPELQPLTAETIMDVGGPRFVRIGEAVFNVETIRSLWVGEPIGDDGEARRPVRITFTDGTDESGTIPLLAPDPRDTLVAGCGAAPAGGEEETRGDD